MKTKVKAEFDIALVGGGVMGLAILYHLSQKKKYRVALFEQQRVGGGASYKSGGFLRLFHYDEKEILWALETLEFLQNYSQETGYNKIGGYFFPSKTKVDLAFEPCQFIKTYGKEVELTSGERIDKLLPQVVKNSRSQVVFEPEAGFADPLKTCIYYSELAQNQGATIFEGAKVGAITHCLDGVKFSINDQVFKSSLLVIAAGAWSSQLLNLIGSRAKSKPKIIQADCFLRNTQDFPSSIIIDETLDIYTRPIGNGQQLLGMATQQYDCLLDVESQSNPLQTSLCLGQVASLLNINEDNLVCCGSRVGVDGYAENNSGLWYWLESHPRILVCEGWSGGGFKLAHGVGKEISNEIVQYL